MTERGEYSLSEVVRKVEKEEKKSRLHMRYDLCSTNCVVSWHVAKLGCSLHLFSQRRNHQLHTMAAPTDAYLYRYCKPCTIVQ